MRKPLKVFLSGPISSRMETYKAEFDDAARIVIEAGHLPLNPATPCPSAWRAATT